MPSPKPMLPVDRHLAQAAASLADARTLRDKRMIRIWSAEIDRLLDRKLSERVSA